MSLVVPQADANLLSLMEVVSSINGFFRGDTRVFEILNADDQVILTGENTGDGFWKCTLDDVQKSPVSSAAPMTPIANLSPMNLPRTPHLSILPSFPHRSSTLHLKS